MENEVVVGKLISPVAPKPGLGFALRLDYYSMEEEIVSSAQEIAMLLV